MLRLLKRPTSVFRLTVRKMASGRSENELGSELSPYLRQHKDNPVHWMPWGQPAIDRARSEGKLIFLSIGYSTCHWCHVMERESFESQQVADVMNQHYVNVKVDREERPDVDKVYMTFVQATTGSGGWPLSVFLSPDLNPVYGGTYFPPASSFGRPGFKQLLEALATQWQDNQEDMTEAGVEVMKIINSKLGPASNHPGPLPTSQDVFHKFYAQLSKSYDAEFGGYSKAPKFPQPSNLKTMFNLHCWDGESDDRKKRELEMNLFTLEMMSRGGIHDHISQGFARYSTDRKWHVPHFEKMLYDQAQLAVVYSIAVRLTASADHKATVEDILTYVSRDLTHPMGGFYTAEDADSLPDVGLSSKKEGAFCVWEYQQIKDLLSEQIPGTDRTIADLIINKYNVKEEGNVNPQADPHGELTGKNVLTELPVQDDLLDKDITATYLQKGRQRLFEERLKRPRPSLDNKILCSSNALMISGYCHAGAALDRQDYICTAITAAQFILTHMFDHQSCSLTRSVYGRGSEVEQLGTPIPGFISDYSFTVQAMIDLYEATFDAKWLELAVKLQGTQDNLFLDKQNGGYFATREGDSQIIARLKDDHDGAEPSSNSVSALNLLRLGKLLNNTDYKSQAEAIFKLYSINLSQVPVSMSALVEAFLFYQKDGPLLVVNTADESFIRQVRQLYLPFVSMVGIPNTECNGSVIASNSLLKDVHVEQGCGVLVRSCGAKLPVSSVDMIKANI